MNKVKNFISEELSGGLWSSLRASTSLYYGKKIVEKKTSHKKSWSESGSGLTKGWIHIRIRISQSYPGDVENLAVDCDADAALRFRGRAVILPQLFQGHVLRRQENAMTEMSSFLVSEKK
jgi:hypothetical protein